VSEHRPSRTALIEQRGRAVCDRACVGTLASTRPGRELLRSASSAGGAPRNGRRGRKSERGFFVDSYLLRRLAGERMVTLSAYAPLALTVLNDPLELERIYPASDKEKHATKASISGS